jgi:hypothetical protein
MPLVPLRSWGTLISQRFVLLNCFSEQSSLKILPVWQFYPSVWEWLPPESRESQILSHGGRGVAHQTDQKSVPMRPFWPN